MLGLSSPYAVEVEDDKCLGGYVQTVQAQMDHGRVWIQGLKLFGLELISSSK